MLVRNNVTVEDAKSPDFDNLKSYVRPVTNKKFMDLFRVKTVLYAWGLPTYDKKGRLHDSKAKKLLREKLGEPPVLLDSAAIVTSVDQLKIVMRQLGYFDAEVDYTVAKNGRKGNAAKKAKVDYFVTAHSPYTISQINYDIPVMEYKRIVVLNHSQTLLQVGMQYNESLINNELTRIINLIRDEGYYYVEKSVIRCEAEFDPPDSLGNDPKSLKLTIMIRIPQNEYSSRYLYKYYFNDIYVDPNTQSVLPEGVTLDTTYFHWRSKMQYANLYFINEVVDGVKSKPPFYYGTLASAIYSRTGQPYSQIARSSSSRALNSLDNFDYVNIIYRENDQMLDTLSKTGYIDVIYKMIRKKQHSAGGQLELRNDKSSLSLSYTNRNLFRGAEHLTINLSGGYFYYSLNNLFQGNKAVSYPEFGISATLDFPNKLFLFNRHASINTMSRSTSVSFGVNYSGLYRRLMYNSALTYRWAPSSYTLHTVSPIDVSTINNSDKRYSRLLNYDTYPESYQKRFGKFFLLSAKYSFNYLVPKFIESRKHNMHLTVNAESSGLLVKGLNALFSPEDRWTLGKNQLDSTGYDYSTFEKLDVTWNYTYTINKDNSVAMRSNVGFMIPLDKWSNIPYEKGFYVGTSNSMRGWGYRGLGPGSYERKGDTLYTGDIKIEMNLEYRGTLYRSFKYGLFLDVGNIWLARKNQDMPGAEFSFKRFYRELAADVGVGIRLDLNFFVIRVDYALPVYDPNRSEEQGKVINKEWFRSPHPMRLLDGLKVAIGYAF